MINVRKEYKRFINPPVKPGTSPIPPVRPPVKPPYKSPRVPSPVQNPVIVPSPTPRPRIPSPVQNPVLSPNPVSPAPGLPPKTIPRDRLVRFPRNQQSIVSPMNPSTSVEIPNYNVPVDIDYNRVRYWKQLRRELENPITRRRIARRIRRYVRMIERRLP